MAAEKFLGGGWPRQAIEILAEIWLRLPDNCSSRPAAAPSSTSHAFRSHGELFTIDPAAGLHEVTGKISAIVFVSGQNNLDCIFGETGACASSYKPPKAIPLSNTRPIQTPRYAYLSAEFCSKILIMT